MTAALPAIDTIHAFTISPAIGTDGRCFSACDSGIWRSTDGGLNWRQVYAAAAPDQPVTATCFAYASGGTSNVMFAGALGTVLRSVDGGDTWRPAVLPPPAPLVTCLAISPGFADDGVILAGTLEDGILRSDDWGERWRRWNFGLLDLTVYAMAVSPDFSRDDTLFAGTETALFRSENGGRSWRETAFPVDLGPVLALALTGDGTLWAGTEQHGIWRSADQGETWRRDDDGSVTGSVDGLLPAGEALLALLPDSIVLRRRDGSSWRPVVAGLADQGGLAGAAISTPADVAGNTARIAHGDGTADAPGPGRPLEVVVQLRDGSVRSIRIEGMSDQGKGNQ